MFSTKLTESIEVVSKAGPVMHETEGEDSSMRLERRRDGFDRHATVVVRVQEIHLVTQLQPRPGNGREIAAEGNYRARSQEFPSREIES